MSNYKNGPGNIPRLPDRVVDCLINSAGVSCAAPGRTLTTVRDQTANVEQLVHAACEELLARLPAPLPAEQPSNPAPRKREVLAICDAYESGIGHGLQRDGHSSGAIWSDPGCAEAYEIGYAEGLERSEPEARIVGQQTKIEGK